MLQLSLISPSMNELAFEGFNLLLQPFLLFSLSVELSRLELQSLYSLILILLHLLFFLLQLNQFRLIYYSPVLILQLLS